MKFFQSISRILKYLILGLFVVLTLILFHNEVTGQTGLQEIFLNPPDEARPRGYWIWAHGNFDYSRITEELEAFKSLGLGGVDIYDMGISDPYDIIPAGNSFLSEAMLDGIEFALEEAKRLDLAMGLSVSNGWNAGGAWTTPDEMIMRLLFWKDTLQGPATLSEIGFPEIPTTFEKPYGTFELFPQLGKDGFPVYYENVALVAFPVTKDMTNVDLKSILYFDPDKINGNRVNIELPAGNWVLARAVVSPLGQKMWMRSDLSEGFIMDHYSRKATKHHFEYVIRRLEDRLGDVRETALERLYLASFEAEDYIIWSPDLKETFFDMHGYTLDPYIPVFAGLTVVDEETSRRFLYDYRLTVSEMFINNHYRQARNICNQHGLLLASESGGPGPPLHYVPTEDLKALGSVNVMRGEFWNREPEYFDEHGNDLTYVVKNIASAAHIYGHKVVEMEAFTSHRKHWQERPVELKKLADEAFCTGMTRVVYHTMPHSPKEAGLPGWSYQAGTHISPNMTWWKLSGPFHDYLTRTSALLQQGHFVADVAYYYGEKIPNFAIGVKFIRKSLGSGYDYDDLNKEILLQSTVDGEGRIVLPSGMRYELLVLPNHPEMSLEVLHKIEELLTKGASILGDRPVTVPGLKDFEKRERELKVLADKIWGKSKRKQEQKYGKGTVYTGYTEREILAEKGISPDFQYASANHAPLALDYIHRSTEYEDIYFVRNADSTHIQAFLDFRVGEKQAFLFDPVRGTIDKVALFTSEGDRTRLPIRLRPYGSAFIVFSGHPVADRHIITVEKDGQVVFPQNLHYDFDIKMNDQDEIVFMPNTAGNYTLIYNDGATMELAAQQGRQFIELKNSWDVYFPYGWGFEPIQQFDSLFDWREHDNKDLSIFSGTATYRTSFTISEQMADSEKSWSLDLGTVGDVAKVYLNGNEVGTSVFPPYAFNLNGLLRAGNNVLVVDVANTWLNQLVGEKDKDFNLQRTRSNLGTGTREKNRRPWDTYSPLPSGLMGPVRLIAVEKLIIDPL